MALHRRLIAAPIVLSAAVLAGCGGSSGSSPAASGGAPSAASTPSQSPYQIIQASATKTTADTAKIAINGAIKAQGQSLPLNGAGSFDFKGHKGTITLTVPQIGAIETRLLGTTIYEKLPAKLASETGGKQWLKIDLAALAKATGGNGQQLSQLAQSSDPTQSLKYLSAASSSVQTVGQDQVRGVPTTHYRAQVDLAKSAKQSGLGQAAIDTFKKQYGTTTFPMDIWVDGQGRATKIAYTLTSKLVSFSFSQEIYDFGKGDVSSVVAPPAAQTQDLSALLGKAASGGTTG